MFDISGVHSPWLLWCTPSMFDISGVHSPRLFSARPPCLIFLVYILHGYYDVRPPWSFIPILVHTLHGFLLMNIFDTYCSCFFFFCNLY